jgi:hypothetical protein
MSFLKLFGRKEAEPASTEAQDDEKIPQFDCILGEFRFRAGSKELYSTRVNLLLNNPKVSVWELNRPIDFNHVTTIRESLMEEYKKHGEITVFGTVAVFKQQGGQSGQGEHYKIFDGQHRLEALRLIVEENPRINPQVVVELYHTADPIALFSKLNQIKPQDRKLEPSSKKETLANALRDKYGDCIRENQARTNRPRVMLKTLIDTISLLPMYEKDVPAILQELDQIDVNLSKLSMEELFGAEYRSDQEACHRLYEVASKWEFYLGLRRSKNGRLNWS